MIDSPNNHLVLAGLALHHHAVYQTQLDPLLNTLDVVLGSWPHADASGKPHHLTCLGFHYEAWQPEYFLAIEASVSSHPDWSGTGPAKPDPLYRWNPLLLVWDAPVSASLADIKTTQWAEIKQSRESTINAPLATPYGTFDAHAKARASITDAVLLLQTLSAQGTPQTLDWTLADNTVVTLTTAQMVAVGVLLGQQVQAAYAQARSLRLQIDTATTEQEVALVVWV